VRDAAALVRPGGVVVLSTLARSAKAFLLAIVGAEYVANIVPRGTHDFEKFINPPELAGMAADAGLAVQSVRGMILDPVWQRWSLSDTDTDVNYILCATKPDP
jgi:2-polyprenyl-6-hydroxyphenyl methylase / 3-demethylubiquinone-9 3-methyltransferase